MVVRSRLQILGAVVRKIREGMQLSRNQEEDVRFCWNSQYRRAERVV